MKSTEIRIGNYYNEFGIPKQAHPNFILKLYQIELAGKIAVDVSPIPLTPEWLVLNGHSEDNNGHFWINLQTHYLELITMPDGFYPIYAQLPEMSSEDEQRVGLNRINFIHEYQNLFFALTQTELEIK